MRWGLTLRTGALGLGMVALLATGRAAAQEMDDLDIDLNVIDLNVVAVRPRSLWSELTDNRANRKRAFDWLSGGQPDSMIYFAGTDASKWSIGGYGGAQWAPNGINKDGFILRGFLSESLERYTTSSTIFGRTNYDTAISRAYVLPGYLFRPPQMEVQLLAGPDAELDFFFQNGRADRWRNRFGLRAIADIWWEPSRELMLQAALSATTIDNGYTTRLAAGWRIGDWFWIGPEAGFSADFFSQQTRLGAHLTGLRTGDYEWGFAAGRVSDNLGRDGVYARIGLMLRPARAPLFDN